MTFPFSILVKVIDGKVTYLQFLEDTYAPPPASVRTAPGQTEAGEQPFEV